MISLSHKQRFLAEEKLAGQHRDVVATESFQRASETALLQLIAEMPETIDEGTAAAQYHRLMGARAYMSRLLTIAEKTLPESKPHRYGLDHQLK
jgi:hypothetical protein